MYGVPRDAESGGPGTVQLQNFRQVIWWKRGINPAAACLFSLVTAAQGSSEVWAN